MHNNDKRVDWDEYTEKYADFINRNKVKKYFEMDIDSIVGYDKVLVLRDKLERLTGVKPIPVWHPSRGKDEFIKSTIDYPYVALGGIVGAGKGTKLYREYHARFPWFISMAHKNGAKIHGLGFTALNLLDRYHFDSVDSTAWTTGNRFGYCYYFDGKTMQKVTAKSGHRLGDSRAVALNNFNEWVKFQRYAYTHL